MLAWLKIFHLIGMLMWFGTVMLTHGTMSRNLLVSDRAVRRGFAEAIRKLNTRYLLPGLLVSVVTGLWMTILFYGFQAGYIHAKLGFGLLAAVLSVVSVSLFKKAEEMGRNEDDLSAPYRKKLRLWKVLNMIVATLLLLTLISAFLKF